MAHLFYVAFLTKSGATLMTKGRDESDARALVVRVADSLRVLSHDDFIVVDDASLYVRCGDVAAVAVQLTQ